MISSPAQPVHTYIFKSIKSHSILTWIVKTYNCDPTKLKSVVIIRNNSASRLELTALLVRARLQQQQQMEKSKQNSEDIKSTTTNDATRSLLILHVNFELTSLGWMAKRREERERGGRQKQKLELYALKSWLLNKRSKASQRRTCTITGFRFCCALLHTLHIWFIVSYFFFVLLLALFGHNNIVVSSSKRWCGEEEGENEREHGREERGNSIYRVLTSCLFFHPSNSLSLDELRPESWLIGWLEWARSR